MLDYYKVLGVRPTANVETIKRAYCKKAVACHPDHGGSHRAMLLVNRAWDVLSVPERRRQYDVALARVREKAAGQAQSERANSPNRPDGIFYEFWKQDFLSARFHNHKTPCYEFPLSFTSISGMVFVALGMLAAWAVLPWFIGTVGVGSWLRLPLIFGAAWVGSRAGAMFHIIVAKEFGFIK